MKRLHRLLLGSLLLAPVLHPGVNPAQAAELQSLNRASIAFYQPQEGPLGELAFQLLKQAQPGYAYQPLKVGNDLNLEAFLSAVKGYQQTNPADLAPEKTGPAFNFDDRTVTWADVRQVAFAAFAVSPNWSWSPLNLSGPHQTGSSDAPQWAFRAESKLDLKLDLYQVTPTEVKTLAPLQESWQISKEIPIRNIEQILNVVKGATGVTVDLKNPDHQALVLEVVKKIPSFKEQIEQDPASYLAEAAYDTVRASGLSTTLAQIKQRDEFKTANSPSQPPDKSPASSDDLIGLEFALRAGSVPLMMNEFNPQVPFDAASLFVPQVQLDIAYSLKGLNLPDTYVTLSGGSTVLPVMRSVFAQNQQPPVLGVPVQNPRASAIAINSTIGLDQRWHFGGWGAHLGVNGGLLTGLLLDSFVFSGMPNSFSYGGTVLTGAFWEPNPHYRIGADVGFRYFTDGFFFSGGQPVAFSPLTTLGPVLHAYVAYQF